MAVNVSIFIVKEQQKPDTTNGNKTIIKYWLCFHQVRFQGYCS